jgi:phosphoribosylglycinamide formyltransferase-1
MKRLAIFASGGGSNARHIIEYFTNHPVVQVVLVVCNKPDAGVLSIAAQYNVPALLIEKEQFFRGNSYVDQLKEANIDFIILAGFLWKIPLALIKAYPNKIINIHPALLPKYGGKGMYGQFVHEAVLAARETESGFSIHIIDELYDHGQIIFQASCPLLPDDTTVTLAQRIHALECKHYSEVIERFVINKQ